MPVETTPGDNTYSRIGLIKAQESELESLDLALGMYHFESLDVKAPFYVATNKAVSTIKALSRSRDEGVSLTELLSINGQVTDDFERQEADAADLTGRERPFLKAPLTRVTQAKAYLSELVSRDNNPTQPLSPLDKVIASYMGKYPVRSRVTPSGIRMP